MKTLINIFKIMVFIAATILIICMASSCSSNDPGPQFDCAALKQDMDSKEAIFNSYAKNPPPSNATPQAYQEWQQKRDNAKNAYIEATRIVDKNCK